MLFTSRWNFTTGKKSMGHSACCYNSIVIVDVCERMDFLLTEISFLTMSAFLPAAIETSRSAWDIAH